MTGYCFTLFGRFSARYDDAFLSDIERGKAQEIISYLLLNRHQTHHRENLSALFWGDFTTVQSKKYLRQTLWQLQKALDRANGHGPRLLSIQPEWIDFNTQASIWVDVEVFEQSFGHLKNIQGGTLSQDQVQTLKAAVDLYTGQLLQGWYYDWCVFERDRLEGMYLLLLDKLMDYCEAAQEYDEGVSYGVRILRYDRAREITHRRLIRLFYLAGDRTAALHQYKRCADSLQEELGVSPAARTLELYEHVRADRWETVMNFGEMATPLRHTLERLNQVQAVLNDIQDLVKEEIGSIQHLIQPDQ